jgi:subtilisin-like proprotein convertase family protein
MKRAALLLLFICTAAYADDGLRLDYERQSVTATYRHYTQILDGLEVVGGGVIERIDHDGNVREVHRAIAHAPSIVRRRMPASDALANVPPGMVRDETLVAVNVNGVARMAWRVVVEPVKHERVAHYVDASTGEILRVEPLYATVQARVFDVNPVAKLNRTDLADQNNSATAVPDSAYSVVDLDDLFAGSELAGPYVFIADLDAPTTPAADPTTSLMFDRSQPQFEDVNAYFHIDRIQRYLISLGYSGSRRLVAYSIPVDPHAANGTDNSYFLRSFTPGQGQLLFGEGGTDDAEDSDIVLHEFGHAIQEWISPGTFTGAPSSNAPALGEGFADYWAFSNTYSATIASGRDPFCFADWDSRCAGDDPSAHCGYAPGADCLRRVDTTKTMSDYMSSDAAGTEHLNGEIWSSALREIFMTMTSRYGADAGKRMCDTIVLEGTFGAPPNPSFAAMAKKLIEADVEINHGSETAAICSAMTTRGILQASDCSSAPRGELTIIPAGDHGVAIPDNEPNGLTLRTTVTDARSIEKLYVGVDITHTSRGDLQLTIVAPDGTSAVLLRPSIDRTANVQVTYGLDAQPADPLDVFHGRSAAGEWKLIVQDLRPRDSGSLMSWSLQIQFSGDLPLASRPIAFGARRFIPVVAHVAGANATNFATDVRILNRSNATQRPMLVFTRTGENGAQNFAAVKIELAPHATMALDDIVSQTMRQPAAGGNLDIVGDSNALVVTSRTFTTADTGTYGQSIPAILTTNALAADGGVRHLIPVVRNAAFRSNYGFSEVGGGSGTVRFSFFDANGNKLADRDETAQPFTHRQTVADIDNVARAEVRVIAGDARVIPYASMIDNVSGDPTYIEAQQAVDAIPSLLFAPAIHADGVNGTAWRTDVTVAGIADSQAALQFNHDFQSFTVAPGETVAFPDYVASLFHEAGSGLLVLTLFNHGSIVAATRTWTNSDHGSYGVGIPPIPAAAARAPGDPAMDVIHLESSAAFRTNIGLMEVGGKNTTARVIVYDAAGRELTRRDIDVSANSVLQMSLRSLFSDDVYDARITVENIGQSGRVFAYGSVNDNRSGDPIFIGAQ